MLPTLRNPFEFHEKFLSLQSMSPPKRFDNFPPLLGGCSEGFLDAVRFFFKIYPMWSLFESANVPNKTFGHIFSPRTVRMLGRFIIRCEFKIFCKLKIRNIVSCDLQTSSLNLV